MPEQLMYITWNLDTGVIRRISGAPIPDSIAVPLSTIQRVVLGEESVQRYRVKYNTKDKKYELINNIDFELIVHNINDSLYKINPCTTDTKDVTITQNVSNNTWTFALTEPQPIDKLVWFAVTQKDNPNVLIRSFSVNLLDLSKDNVVFDFINTEDEASKDVSIFTTRIFDEYNFIQVEE